MKHINKSLPPADFTDFIQKEHPSNWSDIHSSTQHPHLYDDCRCEIFIAEQNGLGGYTERPLSESRNLHIDHYKKKGMNWSKDVTFDWNNLIVEERANQYGACYKDRFTNKIGDYDKLINPVEDYPENLMTYLPTGEIIARRDISNKDIERVNFTIDRFNLNHKLLKSERECLIKLICESYSSLNDDEIRLALAESGYSTVVDWSISIRKLK